MMAPSPVMCRPSAARHRPLQLRSPALRAAVVAALPLRRREALPHALWIAADPWASARAWTSLGLGTGRRDAARCAAAGQVAGTSSAGVGRSAGMEVVAAAAAVVAMGTGNRALYKLALVPLRKYPFFLAQFATFGCVRAPSPPFLASFAAPALIGRRRSRWHTRCTGGCRCARPDRAMSLGLGSLNSRDSSSPSSRALSWMVNHFWLGSHVSCGIE